MAVRSGLPLSVGIASLVLLDVERGVRGHTLACVRLTGSVSGERFWRVKRRVKSHDQADVAFGKVSQDILEWLGEGWVSVYSRQCLRQ